MTFSPGKKFETIASSILKSFEVCVCVFVCARVGEEVAEENAPAHARSVPGCLHGVVDVGPNYYYYYFCFTGVLV